MTSDKEKPLDDAAEVVDTELDKKKAAKKKAAKAKAAKAKKLKFTGVPAEPEELPLPVAPPDDDEILSSQLSDLRKDLQSPLPEPGEEFANFEGLSRKDEKAIKGSVKTSGKIMDKSSDDEEEASIKLPNMPKYTVIGGVILLVIGIIAAVLYLTVGQVTVPDMVGMSAGAATKELNAVGLRLSITELEVPGVPPGRVVAQVPGANQKVLIGTVVNLTVAAAGEQVSVPDVAGKPFNEAKEILSSARLLVDEVRTFDNSVTPGSVVGFLPVKGTQVMAGSTVSVLVSMGSVDAPVEVPSVTGLSEEVAQRVLIDEGFNPVFFYSSTAFGGLNEVAAQTPGGYDMVSPGSTVLVLISLGNSTTDLPVPNLVGTQDAQARATISAAGFEGQRFGIINSTIATGTVISQMPPAARTLLRAGDPLGYLVSLGDETNAEVPDVLGDDLETAMERLREAGFTPRMVPRLSQLSPEEATRGKIQQQFPRGGSAYHIGLPVLIYLIDAE